MNTGGPAFPHGPLGDSIQHEDGRISHQWQGSAGMDLLDWMAGQALAGLCANPEYAGVGDLTNCAYDYASAMLSEKARREADHSEDKLGKVDHSPDAGKVAEINWELVEALESCEAAFSKFAPQEESAYGMAWIKVRATLAKAKGVA